MKFNSILKVAYCTQSNTATKKFKQIDSGPELTLQGIPTREWTYGAVGLTIPPPIKQTRLSWKEKGVRSRWVNHTPYPSPDRLDLARGREGMVQMVDHRVPISPLKGDLDRVSVPLPTPTK